ncbi:hypothetical protein SAMN05216298_3594 [Glycomyces sambucus]|uniref:DUF1963 domain-containing protein n=1 Tax=Glycomyces sambucus TaxID=380244 RepID=A0A1G9JFG5_9ACTN|nr:hypothetical protein [Glycomyces sambucus]SDL35854.1 hypothetical protein SAMN05216298_3594 [Glycomyces sambucus]
MTRTTPPRPYDLLALFPELAAHGRPAVRLHPRRGEPGVKDGSIGGPLLWPADEAWPTCGLEHEDLSDEPYAYVLAWRDYLDDRDRREGEGGLDWGVERRRADELEARFTAEDDGAPPPLIPLAQLYYRDVPHLPWADRYDLLQVLWCPRDHPDIETPYNPALQLRWRRTEQVGPVLADPPVPLVCNGNYVPRQCVLHPETVTEYPLTADLPADLAEAIRAWSEQIGDGTAYHWGTSSAPGMKTTGYGGTWGIIDPYPIRCECGERQLPLFTTATGEFDGGTTSWRPVEEAGTEWEFADPVDIVIGRGYTLQLYYCPASEDHPNRTEMF